MNKAKIDVKELAEELSKADGISANEWYAIFYEAERIRRQRQKDEAEERERARLAAEKKKHEEVMAAATTMDLPSDWTNAFSESEFEAGVHAGSISDGLILSIKNLGRVDIEYIAMVSGDQIKNVISTLAGSIYQNPDTWEECFYMGWETADQYLSGNLMRKYRAAEAANKKYEGLFAENLKALTTVMPSPASADDIYITLGSPWVPTDVIDDFIKFLFERDATKYDYYKTLYEPVTGTWQIPNKNHGVSEVKSCKIYGTQQINALHILEKTLNMQSIKVFDEVSCTANKSGKKLVLNQFDTVNAAEKQQKIITAFKNWVWADDARKERLERIFDDTYGACLKRNFRGDFLEFPEMNKNINLHGYQKDAVAKILFSPNVLLAHEVGAGKTYVMAAAGMEMRRMGISKKNLYVVPNNVLRQWCDMFLVLYPSAKILYIAPKDFTPDKRAAVFQKIKTKDFDAIIMAYSSFNLIPLSKKHYKNEITQKLAKIDRALHRFGGSRLSNQRKKLEKELELIEAALITTLPEDCFDDLGINTLFVDEAHNFKNISINSKIDNISGVNKKGSDKCNEMLDKVRCVQQKNNGRGVVFATGTPITNSVTDVFVMQTYLQYGELKLLNLDLFDNWAGMFAEKTDEFEIDVTTTGYRLSTRFAKFHNLPELTAVFAQVTDFLRCPHAEELPDFDGYSDRLIGKTKPLADYITSLASRSDDIRTGRASKTADNMLKITGDGRRAALDMRLIDPSAQATMLSKAYSCAETAAAVYHRTAAEKSTQLIFCDTSVPGGGFNLYDEIKALLAGLSVKPSEIAFIHDYETDKRKEEIYTKVREGEVRILLGSTFKLGQGVNVQKKLVALHHLDIPWRPSDMAQREGRILRPGNENKKIFIYRYITEGSFDAYSWQLLETKQRFIVNLLSGFETSRTSGDIDDTVLSYAEVKALAIGNPLVKKRIETVNNLMRLNALNRNMLEMRQKMKQDLEIYLPRRITEVKETLKRAADDKKHYDENKVPSKQMKNRDEIRKALQVALNGNVLRRAEKPLCDYQGFQIILPPNMIPQKPFVWLKRAGRYTVETGDAETGNLIRIDNFLNSLADYISENEGEFKKLLLRRDETAAELNKQESYAEEILRLKQEIAEMDKKLGVTKK